MSDEVDAALGAWGAYDRDNPFPIFSELRARGPVHSVTLADGHTAWAIIDHEHARTALSDLRFSKDMQAAFASGEDMLAEGLPGPALARHMLAVDPPDHTRLRRLVASAFSLRRIEALQPHVQGIVDDLLDAIATAGPDATVDLVASFAFPLPYTVICELLGVRPDERKRLGDELGVLLAPAPTPETYARAEQASANVVSMLDALVAEKTDQPADDLVSALVAARDDEGRLSHDELLATIFQLIIAGHDTTTSLIGNGVVALLRHPDQLARLHADPSLIPAAIEEVMRYDSPVPHATFRFTTEDVEVGGTTIPAGSQVLITLASANRDEDQFSSPEELDITRNELRHIAFGHGIHFCLGAPLARMEGAAAFTSLLGRFPELRLAVPDAELHWGHGDGIVLRGLSSLPVIPGPDRRR